MIEVEQKFILSPVQKGKLIQDSAFIAELVWTDVYYDTPDYRWSTKDVWLRTRDGKFCMKVPDNTTRKKGQLATQYHEIEGEQKIAQYLGLSGTDNLKDLLASNGYIPITTFTTHRRKYQNGDFTIDFDLTDFGYEIVEIELMVSDPKEVTPAVDRITEFARVWKLAHAPVRGKVIEFIKRNNPVHYRILKNSSLGRYI